MIWENGNKTCIISYKKQIASPGSMQDALDWYTGMTLRDGIGREVGGGFRMGTRVHPLWIHVDVWQREPAIVPELRLLAALEHKRMDSVRLRQDRTDKQNRRLLV